MVNSSEELGSALRSRRKELKISQELLADLSGVSARTIHELESGKSAITFPNLLALMSVLGLSLRLEVNTSGR